ncbi:MAG: four helix bundle suffix domain-containing protein [Candidatus Helarchaeota archaeon]
MTNRTNWTNKTKRIIPPHGGYRKLRSYQIATLIYDLTVEFCKKYMSYQANKTNTRTYDQMVQAARSGRQNIAEGSQTSGTSKKTELKLINVARASLEELLLDYEDFLRQRGLPLWGKENIRTRKVRALAYKSDKSYTTYKTYMTEPEEAANMLICLTHQACYLLDRQIAALEKEFLEKGGFSERLYQKRTEARQKNNY